MFFVHSFLNVAHEYSNKILFPYDLFNVRCFHLKQKCFDFIIQNVEFIKGVFIIHTSSVF